jgi:hypothetical protein
VICDDTELHCVCLPQVLSIFPTTIRRRILRQLYSNPLKDCYLFDKTGVKFLDALMLGARVELFLPKVSHSLDLQWRFWASGGAEDGGVQGAMGMFAGVSYCRPWQTSGRGGGEG